MENNKKKKVMSDEQIETLRMQIAVYNYICDMLTDLHICSLTLQPSLLDLPLPVKVENTQQKEPLMLYGGQRRRWTPTKEQIEILESCQRRRWTPTKEQIEILESLLKEGNGTHPNKQKIKEITAVLSQHGQVSDANVCNWFQNRRARLKKKMHDSKSQMMVKKTFRFD